MLFLHFCPYSFFFVLILIFMLFNFQLFWIFICLSLHWFILFSYDICYLFICCVFLLSALLYCVMYLFVPDTICTFLLTTKKSFPASIKTQLGGTVVYDHWVWKTRCAALTWLGAPSSSCMTLKDSKQTEMESITSVQSKNSLDF